MSDQATETPAPEAAAPPPPPPPPAWAPKLIPAAELLEPFQHEDGPQGEDLLFTKVYGTLKDSSTDDTDAGTFKESDKFKPKEGWKVADWRAVETLATEVLTQRAKDLRVAAYLARAVGRRGGVAGMREGLWMLVELQDKFWDCLQPLPEKVKLASGQKALDPLPRIADIQPVFDDYARLVAALPKASGSESEAKAAAALVDLDGLEAERDRFRTVLGQRLQGKAPKDDVFAKALGEVIASWKAVFAAAEARREKDAADAERRKREVEEGEVRAKQEAERRAQEEVERQQQLAALGLGGGDPAAAAAALASGPSGGERDGAIRAAVRAGGQLRKLDPNDAVAYRLLFLPLWDEANSKGSVEPPPEQVRSLLPKLHAEGNLQVLGEACLAAMNLPAARDWLDIAWYLAVVQKQVGERGRPGLAAIEDLLAARLRREAGWPGSAFTDGFPMARPEAQAWAAEVASAAMKAAQGAGAAGIPADELEKARAMAAGGRVNDALDHLQALVQATASPRDQFLRRLDFAEFCAANGAPAVADVNLCRLAAQVQDRALESWESPRLLARIYGGIYHRSKSGSAECAALAPVALERLRFLDPRRALEAGG